MNAFREYWTFSVIRGALTTVAAIAIFVTPQAASSLLSVPVLITLAVVCYATYSAIDAAFLLMLRQMLPERAKRGPSLYWQAAYSTFAAGLLYMVTYGAINLRWALWIAASQAAVSAWAEWAIARDTHVQYGCLSCYTTSMVLASCALGLPTAGHLSPTSVSLALATYVGLYGASELLLGARMLLLEYRTTHPAHPIPTFVPATRESPVFSCLTVPHVAISTSRVCSDCPAEFICKDPSLAGQIVSLMTSRQPAVVQSIRMTTLLRQSVSH